MCHSPVVTGGRWGTEHFKHMHSRILSSIYSSLNEQKEKRLPMAKVRVPLFLGPAGTPNICDFAFAIFTVREALQR